MAQHRKIVINLYHAMDFGKNPFKIKILNSGKIVHSLEEVIHGSIPYLWEQFVKGSFDIKTARKRGTKTSSLLSATSPLFVVIAVLEKRRSMIWFPMI